MIHDSETEKRLKVGINSLRDDETEVD